MLRCPPLDDTKKRRCEKIMSTFDEWMSSMAMQELVDLSGGKPNVLVSNDLPKKMKYLYEFANIWDFRKGKERWTISDESMDKTSQERIWRCAEKLGLRGVEIPQTKPDYIFVLGGARLSNLHRARMANKILKKFALSGKTVVALSAFRPLSVIEIPYISQYAPDAKTEYEALQMAMRETFNIDVLNEKITKRENDNLTSACCTFSDDQRENKFYLFAAPSSAPNERRANTLDTYHFCFDMMDIPKGSSILIVTSDIYVQFQLARFLPLAIEKEVYAYFLGTQSIVGENNAPAPAKTYLQEIKATIDAIYDVGKTFRLFDYDNH